MTCNLPCFKQESLTLPMVLIRSDPGWMKLKGMDTRSCWSREICKEVELTAGWKGTTWGRQEETAPETSPNFTTTCDTCRDMYTYCKQTQHSCDSVWGSSNCADLPQQALLQYMLYTAATILHCGEMCLARAPVDIYIATQASTDVCQPLLVARREDVGRPCPLSVQSN